MNHYLAWFCGSFTGHHLTGTATDNVPGRSMKFRPCLCFQTLLQRELKHHRLSLTGLSLLGSVFARPGTALNLCFAGKCYFSLAHTGNCKAGMAPASSQAGDTSEVFWCLAQSGFHQTFADTGSWLRYSLGPRVTHTLYQGTRESGHLNPDLVAIPTLKLLILPQ